MNIVRLFIIILVEVLLAGLLHLLRFSPSSSTGIIDYFSQVNVDPQNLSDSLFVVSIVIGMPSLAGITEAFKLFQGFSYAMRVLISPSYKMTYPSFNDYKDAKSGKTNSTFFLEVLIASALLVFVAYLLARASMV